MANLITTLPKLVGKPVVGEVGVVHSSQKNPVGLRCQADNGAELVYMQGVSGVVYGTWVNYDELYIPILLDTDTVEAGRIAIATAAIDATTKFGWYWIYGIAEGLCLASFADDATVYATSTGGSVDDADTGVGYIHGALGRSARDTTLGTALFELDYPFNSGTGADLPN